MFRINSGGFRIDSGTTNIQNTPLALGDYYGGGIIGYFYQPGDPGYVANVQHGIIISSTNLSQGSTWGCNGTTITGLNSSLGGATTSTNAILAQCGTRPIMASVARAHNGGGFNDWQLPTIGDLNALFTERYPNGMNPSENFTNYVSSTQNSSTTFLYKDFVYNQTFQQNKNWVLATNVYIRAIRYF